MGTAHTYPHERAHGLGTAPPVSPASGSTDGSIVTALAAGFALGVAVTTLMGPRAQTPTTSAASAHGRASTPAAVADPPPTRSRWLTVAIWATTAAGLVIITLAAAIAVAHLLAPSANGPTVSSEDGALVVGLALSGIGLSCSGLLAASQR